MRPTLCWKEPRLQFARNHKRQERCPHPERVTTTTNFGLERLVCTRCGEIEVRNLPEHTVVRAESLKAAAARR